MMGTLYFDLEVFVDRESIRIPGELYLPTVLWRVQMHVWHVGWGPSQKRRLVAGGLPKSSRNWRILDRLLNFLRFIL